MVEEYNNLEADKIRQEKFSKLSLRFAVSGWLGFLCFGLTLFIRATIINMRGYKGFVDWGFERSMLSIVAPIVILIVLIALMLFGIYFGGKERGNYRNGVIISILGLIAIFLSSPIILVWSGVIGFRICC